jgi:hypothetical protein
MAEDVTHESSLDEDFRQLSRKQGPGEPMTDEDWAASQRIVNAYWPRFHPSRPLPKQWC